MNWFSVAFTAWGAPVSWLEVLAFGLSLWMIAHQMRVQHWTWPLAIASSALYAVLFANSKLYGEASLQLFFIAISIWGWWQWLRRGSEQKSETPATALKSAVGMESSVPKLNRGIVRMPKATALRFAAGSATLFVAIGLLLSKASDSDVPWIDAAPTALSVAAQIMLGRKYLENWWLWIVVNGFSTWLFAHKALYLTSLLYAVFTVLSVVGWRTWQAHMAGQPPKQAQ